MVRRTLTDKGVAALKPRAKRYHFADPEMKAHFIRVMPSGTKSFAVFARDPSGKQVLHTIGAVGVITIEEARQKAREAVAAFKDMARDLSEQDLERAPRNGI